MTPNRRTLSLGLVLLPLAGRARAAGEADRLTHGGFSIDMGAVPASGREALAAYLRGQIDLVESLPIREDIKTWFRTVPLTIDPALNEPGHFDARGLRLDDTVSPADNPVLLHELLHVYQARRLTGGPRNPELRAFFAQAGTSGDWPAGAYMLSNLNEFFAMTGSVALWGRAARPPRTRARLIEVMPDYYAWLVKEFGLRT